MLKNHVRIFPDCNSLTLVTGMHYKHSQFYKKKIFLKESLESSLKAILYEE